MPTPTSTPFNQRALYEFVEDALELHRAASALYADVHNPYGIRVSKDLILYLTQRNFEKALDWVDTLHSLCVRADGVFAPDEQELRARFLDMANPLRTGPVTALSATIMVDKMHDFGFAARCCVQPLKETRLYITNEYA